MCRFMCCHQSQKQFYLQVPEVAALGDWLLGACPAKCAPVGQHFSQNPEDWLLSQTESKVRDLTANGPVVTELLQARFYVTTVWSLDFLQTSCPVLASVDFMQAWGHLRDLETWLLQNQTPISRERTSSSCSSTLSIEKIDESEFNITPQEGEGDLSDWLITPPNVAMETMSDAERWWQVLKPFEDTWSPSDWLVESSRLASDCSSCCQTTKAMEIENLGQLKCLKTSMAPPEGPVIGLGAWLQQAVPVPQTCRANELCSTYSDCVCEDNCGKEALSLWLLQQDGRDKNGVSVTTNTLPPMKTALVANSSAQSIGKPAPFALYHREQEQKVTVCTNNSCDLCSVEMQTHPLTCSLMWTLGPGDPRGLATPHQEPIL